MIPLSRQATMEPATMNRPLTSHARTILCAAIAGLSAMPVAAQGMLEEVIVTAQKREATLSDTPIAITAVSSDQISAPCRSELHRAFAVIYQVGAKRGLQVADLL